MTMKQLILIVGIAVAILSAKAIQAQTYFKVDVKGKGKPMILIHGLYCTAEVWKETVARYEKNYECHVLTLAGFGDQPAHLNDHFLVSVKDDLLQYIKRQETKPAGINGAQHGWLHLFSGGIICTGCIQ